MDMDGIEHKFVDDNIGIKKEDDKQHSRRTATWRAGKNRKAGRHGRLQSGGTAARKAAGPVATRAQAKLKASSERSLQSRPSSENENGVGSELRSSSKKTA